jgi:hypothetical protein
MSPPGNNRRNRSGGFVFLSVIIALLIVGMAFGTMAGSIAILVRNVALIKIDLLQGIEKRNTLALEKKIDFEREE